MQNDEFRMQGLARQSHLKIFVHPGNQRLLWNTICLSMLWSICSFFRWGRGFRFTFNSLGFFLQDVNQFIKQKIQKFMCILHEKQRECSILSIVLLYHITFCIRSIPRLVIRYNEHIPGAYSFGKVHFVFSISVRNASEQWHLFSSSVNLSMKKKYQQLAPAPWLSY